MSYPCSCLTCLGDGGYLLLLCHCRGPCYHEPRPVPCEECRCVECGESGADRVMEDGDRVHAGCLVEDPSRWEDGPVVEYAGLPGHGPYPPALCGG